MLNEEYLMRIYIYTHSMLEDEAI